MNSNIIYDVLTPPFLTPLFLRWILIRRDHGSRKKSNAGAKQSVHGTLHSEMPRTSQAKGMSSFSDVILGNNRRNSHSTVISFPVTRHEMQYWQQMSQGCFSLKDQGQEKCFDGRSLCSNWDGKQTVARENVTYNASELIHLSSLYVWFLSSDKFIHTF